MGLGQPLNVMQKSEYDADVDGVVDKTEGVREVAEFPASPAKGDIVMKNDELYVCTGT